MTAFTDALRERLDAAYAEQQQLVERHAALLTIIEACETLLRLEGTEHGEPEALGRSSEAGTPPEPAAEAPQPSPPTPPELLNLSSSDIAHSQSAQALGQQNGSSNSASDEAEKDEPALVVCTCSPLPWKTRGFDPRLPNEAHQPDCAMYRKGAHRWPLPDSGSGEGPFEIACIWCGETKQVDARGIELTEAQL